MNNKSVYVVYAMDENSFSNTIESRAVFCFLEADKAEYFVKELNLMYLDLAKTICSCHTNSDYVERTNRFREKYDQKATSFSKDLYYYIEELELKQ